MLRPVLTAAAMREADRQTIEDLGMPGFTLMETAGRESARHILERFGPFEDRPVLVLAGKGNNGGDGLVVARVLHARGARVHVVSLATEDGATPDAGLNLRLLGALAGAEGGDRLRVETFGGTEDLEASAPHALVVDALLGTGITSAVRGRALELVRWTNAQSAPVVALDVPTGVDSDTGRVHGEAVQARLTVTMGAAKVGLLVNEGAVHAGHVEVVEIGIPVHVLQRQAEKEGCALAVDEGTVRDWLPHRAHDAHKFSVGFALVVAGSPGLTGAAAMAARAAARSGAGYVVCACPRSVQPVLAQKLTTEMPLGLPDTDEGELGPDALDPLLERAEKADALLVGCGLGRSESTGRFVRSLLRRAPAPVVIDADGLHALIGHAELIEEHSDGTWILTPHWGEFRRLAGEEGLDIRDRVRLAGDYARRWNCVLLLKGLPSVVGCPDGRVFISPVGNAALATAGTGDVLAGMCVGLRAQGLAPARAAVCALYVGGAAAEAYAETNDLRALVATDLIERLPGVLHARFSHTDR